MMESVKPQLAQMVLDRNHPFNRGLMLDLGFCEGGGDTVRDLSGHESPISMWGTLSPSDWVREDFGYGIEKPTGTSGRLYSTVANVHAYQSSRFTISTLMNAEVPASGSPRPIVDRDYGGSSFFMFQLSATNISAWTRNDSGGNTILTTSSFPFGRPVLVTYTYTPSLESIYFDGVLSISKVPTDGVRSGPANRSILSEGVSSESMKIFSHREWNRDLAASEISSLYMDPWRIYRKGDY